MNLPLHYTRLPHSVATAFVALWALLCPRARGDMQQGRFVFVARVSVEVEQIFSFDGRTGASRRLSGALLPSTP